MTPLTLIILGFEWPKGSSLFYRFASGMWLGAKVGNDTLVAITEYAFEFLNGYTDNNTSRRARMTLLTGFINSTRSK
jgi:hypothetical protein